MFYRNRIKQLEDKIDALEVQVAEILAITSKYYQAVDILLAQKKRGRSQKESRTGSNQASTKTKAQTKKE